jgi:hypothetical protein
MVFLSSSSHKKSAPLSLHHISEIRTKTDSCGFRARNVSLSREGAGAVCAVSVFTPDYCLEMEFLDLAVSQLFVKALRCLQSLERYAAKDRHPTSSSLASSQATQ